MTPFQSAVSQAEGEKLQELSRGKVVLELGAHLGGTTVRLCEVARLVHTVDWFRGDPHAGERDFRAGVQEFIHNTAEADNLVTHIGSFSEVLPFLRRSSFDLVFLDGYHTEEATREALDLALPLGKAPGVLAFHDYGLFGVKPVVDSIGGPDELVESLAIVYR